MLDQGAPVFFKALEGSTLGRRQFANEIKYAVLGGVGNKQGLIVVTRQRCALVFLYQCALPPPSQPPRILRV